MEGGGGSGGRGRWLSAACMESQPGPGPWQDAAMHLRPRTPPPAEVKDVEQQFKYTQPLICPDATCGNRCALPGCRPGRGRQGD